MMDNVYKNVIVFIVGICFLTFYVEAQKAFGRNARGGSDLLAGSQGLLTEPRLIVLRGNKNDSAGADPSSDPVAVSHGGQINARARQNEVLRQETGTGSASIVILDPTRQNLESSTISTSIPSATENQLQRQMGKKSTRKMTSHRRSKHQRKRWKNKVRNRKRKGKKGKLLKSKKQRQFPKAETLEQVTIDFKGLGNTIKAANRWKKRRQRILNRMRARQARLDARKLKEAMIRANEQRLKQELLDKATKTDESVKTNKNLIGNEATGFGNVVNINNPKDKSVEITTGPEFGSETKNLRDKVPVVEHTETVRPVVPGFAVNDMPVIDLADVTNLWSQIGVDGNGNGISTFPTTLNSDGLFIIDPAATVSEVPSRSPESGKNFPLGPFDPRTGVLLGPLEGGTGTPVRVIDPISGVPLGPADIPLNEFTRPFDPASGILFSTENIATNTTFGTANSSSGLFLGQIDTGSNTEEAAIKSAMDFPADTVTSKKEREQVINGKNADGVQNPLDGGFPVEPQNTPTISFPSGISNSGASLFPGSSGNGPPAPVDTGSNSMNVSGENNTGEPTGQVDPKTRMTPMTGIPVGSMDTGAGNQLGMAGIETQDNGSLWIDPSFGESQAAVLQPVDLSEFFSTGNVNIVDKSQFPETPPETKAGNGIRTMNGQIMPVAGQSRGVPVSGTSPTRPRTTTKSSNSPSSLLGFVFDISKALRSGKG